MIAIRQYSILLCVFLFAWLISFGQNPRDPNLKPDRGRELFHDYVDTEQKKALSSDGKDDKIFSPSANEETNIQVTNALITKVNDLQRKIEKDSSLNGQLKVLYIRGLERLLKDLNAGWKVNRFVATRLPEVLDSYEKCMELDLKKTSIESYIEQIHYDVARPLLDCTAFEKNAGYKISRYAIIRKYCRMHPEQIFATMISALTYYPELPF